MKKERTARKKPAAKAVYAHLASVAKEFRSGIVDGIGKGSSAGMCDAVCLPLQGYLSAIEGVETRAVHGDFRLPNGRLLEHWWLELPNGEILDPTADQLAAYGFQKMPPVYVGPKPPFYPATTYA